MKAALVAGGDKEEYKNFKTKYDFILATDKAALYLLSQKIVPDLVLGDMDSVSEREIDKILKLNIPLRKFNSDKNNSDCELGIIELIKRGYVEIDLIGGTGGRLDHEIANILLLEKYSKEVTITLISNKNKIQVFQIGKYQIHTKLHYISFFSLTDFSIISLKNFKYDLDKRKIYRGETLCLSNELPGNIGDVEVLEGKILFIESED